MKQQPQQQQIPPPLPYYLRPNQAQRDINTRMVEIIPELDSTLAATPMMHPKWLKTSYKLDNGDLCFIPSSDGKPRIKDYIWMPKHGKDLNAGYYHLRTQEAYIQINHLLRKYKPPPSRSRQLFNNNEKTYETYEIEIYDKINELMYNRLVSDRPNDVYAARMSQLNIQSSAGNMAKGPLERQQHTCPPSA